MPKKIRIEKEQNVTTDISEQEINGIRYLLAADAGDRLEPEFISWFVTSAVSTSTNIFWMCAGMPYYMGGTDFVEAMNEKYKNFIPQAVDKQ